LCIYDGVEELPYDGIMGFGPDSGVVTNLIPNGKFAIFLNSNGAGGELQLGGYNPSSILSNPIPFLPSFTGKNYGYHVTVDQIRIATSTSSQIVYTRPPDGGLKALYPIETILDSGTSKLMMPSRISTLSGNSILTQSIYNNIKQWIGPNAGYTMYYIYINVSGVEYESIIDQYDLGELHNDYSSTLILGVPFFRLNLIAHDLSDPSTPKVGFARKNPNYIPNKSCCNVATVPINNTRNVPSYYINVEIGTPPISLKLLLDTGSKDLLVGSTVHFPFPTWGYFVVGFFCIAFIVLAARCIMNIKPTPKKIRTPIPEEEERLLGVRDDSFSINL